MTVEGGETVSGTVECIENAVEKGGPTIIAKVDHAENAASIGEDLRETVLIIFGAPEVGTPVIQEKGLV